MRKILVTAPRIYKSIYISLFLITFSFNAYSMNLTELIEGLLNTDTSIKNAESAVVEARNDIKTAWAAYLPELDVKFIRGNENKCRKILGRTAYVPPSVIY